MALTLYSSSRSLGSPGTAPRAITEESVMLLVGLTGNIGSGKSTVAQMLSERGATIIDADVLARRAVELGTAGFEKIIAKWGAAVLGPDGHLDRAALRRVVFADHEQLEELNQIVHPEVERLRGRLVEQARKRGDRLVICDIPLLFERHMTDRFDRIILVDAHRGVRLERLVKDRGLTETEAMDMIAAQMPAELKRARADFIIENDGTLTQLERRVQDVWSSLSNDSSAPRTAAAVP
jgi:dephospho-CoA kinase